MRGPAFLCQSSQQADGLKMWLAVASGKGGAGKTSLVTSLATVWDSPCIVADADVEAPNVHLFLQPEIYSKTSVTLELPVLDEQRCTACGQCASFCRFKGIAKFRQQIVLFPDMCHGCGGCLLLCPEKALLPGSRVLGDLETGSVLQGRQLFIMGRSCVGEALSPPQIRALQAELISMRQGRDVLLDAPPGVSCPAMTAADKADLVLLVAEPTPFGFHDFKLAHEAFKVLQKPLVAVVNRVGIPGNQQGDEEVLRYCRHAQLPVLAELPFAREVAEHYASGLTLASLSAAWQKRFVDLALALRVFCERGGLDA